MQSNITTSDPSNPGFTSKITLTLDDYSGQVIPTGVPDSQGRYSSLTVVWNDLPNGNYGFDIVSSSPPGDLVSNVPIPTTLLLFGSGLIGLVGIRRTMAA